MAEVLAQFDTPVADAEGRGYVARACGRMAEDGLHEGWIEFYPQDGGSTLRTPRETEQPNHAALEYWATGLTLTYLEGALERARRAQAREPSPPPAPVRPEFDRPGPSAPEGAAAGERYAPVPHAVLDPFAVYTQGEDVLRKELSALGEGHLRNILRAYRLAPGDEAVLAGLHRDALAERIVTAVRERLG